MGPWTWLAVRYLQCGGALAIKRVVAALQTIFYGHMACAGMPVGPLWT